MKRTAFLLVAAIAAVFSCAPKTNGSADDTSRQITEEDIIDMTGSFSKYFSVEKEVVMLQDTCLESLLGYVSRAQYDEGLFFIESGSGNTHSIKVFDSNGRYLHSIGSMGRASYEYLDISGWALDCNSKEVVLFDPMAETPCLKFYDYSGQFRRRTDIIDFDSLSPVFTTGTHIAHVVDGETLFLSYITSSDIDTYEYSFVTPEGNVRHLAETDGCKIAPLKNGGIVGSVVTQCDIATDNDDIYMMRRLDNHIYRLNGTDSLECVANLAFQGEIPEEIKHAYEPFKLYNGCQVYIDLQDFTLIHYNYNTQGSPYLGLILDKKAFRIYASRPPLYASFSGIICGSPVGASGNALICCYSIESAQSSIELYEQGEYPNLSKDELELCRQVAIRNNPAMVLCHLSRTSDQ